MEKNIYFSVKISVRALSVLIFVGLAALAFLIAFLSANGGFDVSFETDGGSAVESQRLRYGERVAEPEPPVKEGSEFAGWFGDAELTEKFDFKSIQVEKSMTIYAAWNEIE